MKPFSFEMLVRDSDDLAQLAVMIIKKVMGDDTSNHFSTEILQVISDIFDPLDEKHL